MKRFWLINTILAFCLLLTGCSTSQPAAPDDSGPRVERTPTTATTGNDQVIVIDHPQSLADFLIRVPGVAVDGQGSVDARVTIRGNYPLYVLNGVPIGYSYREANGLVNVNDIASVEVLKTPSETAIYGRQGANGVIVIKTY